MTAPMPGVTADGRSGAPTDAPLLAVERLTTRFPTERGWLTAVDDVSFAVESGEVFGLVGESGSGKTATIRSLIGLIPKPGKVVAGSVRYRGQDLLRLDERALRTVVYWARTKGSMPRTFRCPPLVSRRRMKGIFGSSSLLESILWR